MIDDAVNAYSDGLDKLHERHPEAGYWIHVMSQRLLAAMYEAGL